jgi:DNA polymerase-3 subunit epsilon
MWKNGVELISSSTHPAAWSKPACKSANSCGRSRDSPETEIVVREIVLDTETTGLNPADGHRLLEIGAIEIVRQCATGKVFHTLINPERDVPEDAARVHGYTAAILRDKPVFAGVVDELMGFIGDARLVIHNAEFDLGFLNAELGRAGRQLIGLDRVVDTLTLARRKHPGQPNSLDALCDRYRIDRSRRTKHGALLDAEILVEIYLELTGGRQRSLSFELEADKLAVFNAIAAPIIEARQPRASLIEAQEAAAHAEHVRTLGEAAIWRRYTAVRAEPADDAHPPIGAAPAIAFAPM